MPAGLFIKRRSVWMPLAFLTMLVALYAIWPAPPVPQVPLPSPNGYDDFVRAGKLLGNSPDYSKMLREELRSCINSNQEPLRLVRLGLTRECRKPLEYSKEYFQKHFSELSDLRRLPKLLYAEARLAELEARYGDAAKSYIDICLLGALSPRGGMIVEKLVGLTVESIGISGIEQVVDSLSSAETKESLRRLKSMDERSEGAEEFIERDRLFSERAYSLFERVRLSIEYWTPFWSKGTEAKFTEKIHRTDRLRRQLILRLAARVYELEHGKPPASVEDLVPLIVPSVPVDPETGTNLVLNLSL